MKTDIVNVEGIKISDIDLSDTIFNCKIKEHLLYEVVNYQLAKKRSGCVATKNRSNVRGGGVKPYRQKGTGRARAGTSRSPLCVGGGVVFGPHPRDFSFKVNKKVRKSALCSALSLVKRDGNLIIIDDLAISEVKTKLAAIMLRKLGIEQNVLIVVSGEYDDLKLAVRNLKWVKVLDVEGMNVYDSLYYKKIIILQNALPKLVERLG